MEEREFQEGLKLVNRRTIERNVVETLRSLADQSVSAPFGVGKFSIANTVDITQQKVHEGLLACVLRGWAERVDVTLPVNKPLIPLDPVFRVTSAGWDVLESRRTRRLTLWVALVALSVSFLSLLVEALSLVLRRA